MKPKKHDQLLERQLNIRCNIFDILKVPYSRYLPRGIAWDLFLTHSFHEADDVSREVVIENDYLKQQAKLDLNCPWRETHWACLKSQSQRRMVISRGGRCQSSQKKCSHKRPPSQSVDIWPRLGSKALNIKKSYVEVGFHENKWMMNPQRWIPNPSHLTSHLDHKRKADLADVALINLESSPLAAWKFQCSCLEHGLWSSGFFPPKQQKQNREYNHSTLSFRVPDLFGQLF